MVDGVATESAVLRRQLSAALESGPSPSPVQTQGLATVGGSASLPSLLGGVGATNRVASNTGPGPGGGGGATSSTAKPATGLLSGTMKWAAGDEQFARLGQKDIEQFTQVAKSRAVGKVRSLVYFQKPVPEAVVHERVIKAIQPKSTATAPLEDLPKLERCLDSGPDAVYKRGVLWNRKALVADDLASALIRKSGAGVDWLDFAALEAELDEEEVDDCTDNGEDDAEFQLRMNQLRSFGDGGSDSVPASPSGSRPVSRGASQFEVGRIKGLAASKWLDNDGGPLSHPALKKRRWPSMAKFERYYTVPEEFQPPKPRAVVKQREPLPAARPTISGMEESSSFAAQAYLWPALFQTRQLTRGPDVIPLAQQPSSAKPANFFEAGNLYRQACNQMGIEPLSPNPIFGERVEVKGVIIDGTKQCYALAEAVRACAAKELVLDDTFMIDMGAARIVESAIRGGRLTSLNLSGCCLSYRTCTALHDCLRMRGGSSLTELHLSKCGLGGDLDVDPSELPDLSAAAYARGEDLLQLSIEASKGPEVEDDADEAEQHDEAAGENAPGRSGSKLSRTSSKGQRKSSKASRSQSKTRAEGDDNADEDEEKDPGPPPKPLLLPLLGLFAQRGTALRRLNLSKTVLSIATVQCLGNSMGTTPIEVLNLNQCSLDDVALGYFTEGLTKNRSLLELSLRKNKLSGEKGVINALFDAIGRHVRIAHLDIAENDLPKEIVEELCAAFRWSCSLVAVHLLGGGVSGSDATEIFKACNRWTLENATDDIVKEMDPPQPAPHEELILCRALHVKGLKSWRIVSPKQPAKDPEPAKAAAMDDVQSKEPPVPESWMPSCCWICHKAASVQYKWVVPDRGAADESGVSGARVFVRPSFANFERIELTRQRIVGAKRVYFGATLLVPPGVHSHVFESVVGKARSIVCCEEEPKAETASVPMTDAQREILATKCREYRYNGPVNLLPRVETHGFQISEQLSIEAEETPQADPWTCDELRMQRLQECYEVDIKTWHIGDLCHAEEEAEVKKTLWDIYSVLYETYVIFAGRSQWPLVRQVDVYGFFEEARLMSSSGPGSFGGSDPDLPEPSPPTTPVGVGRSASSPELLGEGAAKAMPRSAPTPLMLQDVQQFLVQTVAARGYPSRELAGGGSGRRGSTLGKRAAAIEQRTREGAPLTRPQFIEVLLRTALALRTSHDTSTSKAFRRFSEKILLSRVMLPPLSPFPRGLTQQVGDVSDTLLARKKTLREAWERFGGSENALQQLSQLLKLCDRNFTAKHVASIYALSRRPHADTTPTGKTVRGLGYDEFCEAIARLALIWQRSHLLPGEQPSPVWPPQPKVGHAVPQQKIASRIEAFLAKLAERMRPAIRSI